MPKPEFIRDFSKENYQQERDEKAQQIKKKRREYFSEKNIKEQSKEKNAIDLKEKRVEIEEIDKRVKDLQKEMENLSDNGLKKIVNYFKIRKIDSEIKYGKIQFENLKKEENRLLEKNKEFSKDLDNQDIPEELKEAKNILNDFYDDQEEKWKEAPYNQEEVEELFNEEHLSSLSLEEYKTLLKRFPSEMQTHVTRQGVRDHTGHMYHMSEADSYSEGFKQILEDGKLRSPLGAALASKEKDKAIEEFLHLDDFNSREEALNDLYRKVDPNSPSTLSSYSDRAALHTALEEVADTYYGSEKYNEIFFANPSIQIASQYNFIGQLSGEITDHQRNDQWIWTNEQKGIDINSGLTFIPKETLVDKKTGSRYKLDQEKKPIINKENIKKFKELVYSPDFLEFADKILEEIGRIDSTDQSERERIREEKLKKYRQKISEKFDIKDTKLINSILDYSTLSRLVIYRDYEIDEDSKEYSQETVDSVIEGSLKDQGIFFELADDPVSAQEYWEEYFKNNPEQKPNKIVYYNESSPTQALQAWKEKNDLKKKFKVEKEVDLDDQKIKIPDQSIEAQEKKFAMGFDKNKVDPKSPEAMAGSERFKVLAEKVINNYFNRKEELVEEK